MDRIIACIRFGCASPDQRKHSIAKRSYRSDLGCIREPFQTVAKALIAIDPECQPVGQVEVALSLGAITRLFPAEAWQRPENAMGGPVFAGRAGEVRTKLDREEAEDASGGEDHFNLDAKIHASPQGHSVPYLDVRATVSRNGQPVREAIPLMPVVRQLRRDSVAGAESVRGPRNASRCALPRHRWVRVGDRMGRAAEGKARAGPGSRPGK